MTHIVQHFHAKYRAFGWWFSLGSSRQEMLHSYSRYCWLARQAKMSRGIEAMVQIRYSGPLSDYLVKGHR